MPELRELSSDPDWERAVPILRQLWSHRDAAFVRSWREDEDYRLLGRFVIGEDGENAGGTGVADGNAGEKESTDDGAGETRSNEALVAVAGVYVRTVLHHECSLWIHDFVVDEAHRGEGHGEALLRDLEAWGAERGCDHVALACTADNDEAAAFYEHVGMEAFGTVYEREL